MKTGASILRRRTSQGSIIRLPDGSGYGWALEGGRIEPLIDVVRAGIQVLARDEKCVATEAGGCGDDAGNGAGLAVLQSEDPIGAPTAQDSVNGAVTVG